MHDKIYIPAVTINHLTVSYQSTSVLLDCSVSIPCGVMVGIIGPNGAGKTTFIKSILGLTPIVSGEIVLAGGTVNAMRGKVAYVPQRNSVDWNFPITVVDMVLMGCYGKLGWFKRPTQENHEKAYNALIEVGLDAMAHSPIGRYITICVHKKGYF
jgi:manganese/zinc/iron transport system ATP- binding protein